MSSAPLEYAFAAAAFDRGVERRENHDALRAGCRSSDSRWLLFDDDDAAPVDNGQTLTLLPGDALERDPDDWVFLGVWSGQPLYAARSASAHASVPSQWLDLRTAAMHLDAGQAGLLAYARALCAWRGSHRHCGRCGVRLLAEAGGHRLRCPACGQTAFPRTDPAIIVLVRDGERCLLGRQASWPSGRYSTLAGFVEPGETLEAAVAREVSEESGVAVADCHYLGSQPWPFPASLMLAFEARARSSDIAVGEELEDARWFDPDTLASSLASGQFRPPPRLSIARWLIDRWHRDLTGQPLPPVAAQG